jgi:hypothetical protein
MPALAGNQLFSAMNSAAVSFYDPSLNTPQFPLGLGEYPVEVFQTIPPRR